MNCACGDPVKTGEIKCTVCLSLTSKRGQPVFAEREVRAFRRSVQPKYRLDKLAEACRVAIRLTNNPILAGHLRATAILLERVSKQIERQSPAARSR